MPIYEILIDDFFPRRQRLIDTVLAMRQGEASVQRSNQGGWHSNEQLQAQQKS